MKFKLGLLLILLTFLGYSNEILRFQVDSGNYDRLNCPVGFEIPQGIETNDIMQLIEYLKDSTKIIPYQFETHKGFIWFILDGNTAKNTIRKFALISSKSKLKTAQIILDKNNGSLKFSFDKNPILNYQYDIKMPPKGIDAKFGKSGFIHPIWSPDGEVLTRIQPPDHYHHYGVWGPWTKTHIEEREVDFWNLGLGKGTVLFKEFLDKSQGNVYSSFTALQEHLDFGASKNNQVALNENLEVRIWNIKNQKKSWLIDYTSSISSPLKTGILFDAYRYGGGIGFRATEKWHKDNTSVLTSENKDRLTADGTKAKWTIIEGETIEGRSGILFMGFPENRQFPEPMRVWPIDANGGRGDMFFEFCPIRHVDWKIEPNKKYQLKYRMLVFKGKISPVEAEIYWQGFANPPEILIEPK